MRREARDRRGRGVIGLLALVALLAMVAFMVVGAHGNWGFVLPFRAGKLAALLLVAYAVAVSTVLFQTITGNRILTPSIIGFDALYILLQSALVLAIGSAATTALDPRVMFVVEMAAMVGFSLVLYRLLFSGAIRNLFHLMLVGIVLGVLFRSLSTVFQRVIDPTEFVVLQDRLFANFNSVDTALLGVAALVVGLVTAAGATMFHAFDVMALGRDQAIALGVDHRRVTVRILVLVTLLVSVSTALVGPVTFFGLLVANLAYMLVPDARHTRTLPAAVLVAVICLVGGQMLLERVLDYSTALSIVIEFAGGLFFILFLLREAVR
ncbi:iron chelate uptake ABC transporter family permease subunit [Pleomorphomonas carboxyditropha]|uniref:Enterobactin ABC transporter permease n=1 Tax=Pleomorphomonas carboxyditropha TaxID=2023338 RepID=A0A2G9WTQ1_9HYPH|nr:iron chelate uptake ABC transporter family permease subunit [Pleomorphomonas carboxyditropha]PIO98083.1 enterobactin ABC transporter permease [Pleomorphomonas carboxyditropha]